MNLFFYDFKKVLIILMILLIFFISIFFFAFLSIIILPAIVILYFFRKYLFFNKYDKTDINHDFSFNEKENEKYIDVDYKKNEEKDI